jgi:hypothetical protein
MKCNFRLHKLSIKEYFYKETFCSLGSDAV